MMEQQQQEQQIDVNTIISKLSARLADAQVTIAVLEARLDQQQQAAQADSNGQDAGNL